MHADINSRAMLVRLSISLWTARKYDRRISSEVNQAHNASQDAGRYNKHLFGGKGQAQAHQAILAAAGAARSAHYDQTLPWDDQGWRMLPTENWMQYTDKMRGVLGRFDSAVGEFMAEYPALRQSAQALLNGLYRDEDYPEPEQLRGRFACATEFQPVPASSDIRVSLPAEHLREIEQSIEGRLSASMQNAVADCWQRMQAVVERAHERLKDPTAVFRDSLIENVREVTDVLRRLNLTNDAALEEMRSRVDSSIARLDPDLLRSDEGQRAAAAKDAAKILADIQAIYGGQQ